MPSRPRFSMGRGYGAGFGFRGASPPWPYVGRGRGGLPRCWAGGSYYEPLPPDEMKYASADWPHDAGMPAYGPPSSVDQELSFLKHQAELLKSELSYISERVAELEKQKEES